MQPVPLISIILVNWNSHEYLSHCLLALSRQTLQSFEIILIDNNSIDKSMSSSKSYWTYLRLIVKQLSVNIGFAVANNIGAKLAHGKWIALLNTDAFPEPNWLENLVQVAEQNPEYSLFSSKQIQYNSPNLLDGAGDAYHLSGLGRHGFSGRPV